VQRLAVLTDTTDKVLVGEPRFLVRNHRTRRKSSSYSPAGSCRGTSDPTDRDLLGRVWEKGVDRAEQRLLVAAAELMQALNAPEERGDQAPACAARTRKAEEIVG
jgi:hypothetical protein